MWTQVRTFRAIPYLLIAAWLVALTWPALAHPRRHAHKHRQQPRAVIVVGQPKVVRHAVVVQGRPQGVLDFNVKPKATQVWVNGTLRGTADSFDGFPKKMTLRPGKHRIKLVTPDGATVERQVQVRAGYETNIGLDLR